MKAGGYILGALILVAIAAAVVSSCPARADDGWSVSFGQGQTYLRIGREYPVPRIHHRRHHRPRTIVRRQPAPRGGVIRTDRNNYYIQGGASETVTSRRSRTTIRVFQTDPKTGRQTPHTTTIYHNEASSNRNYGLGAAARPGPVDPSRPALGTTPGLTGYAGQSLTNNRSETLVIINGQTAASTSHEESVSSSGTGLSLGVSD